MCCFLLRISWNFKLFFCLAENSEILALFLPLKGWVFTSVNITSKLKCWVWHLICSTKGKAYRKGDFLFFYFFKIYIFILVKIQTFHKMVWVGTLKYFFYFYPPCCLGLEHLQVFSLMLKCLEVLEKEEKKKKRTIQVPGPSPASCLTSVFFLLRSLYCWSVLPRCRGMLRK